MNKNNETMRKIQKQDEEIRRNIFNNIRLIRELIYIILKNIDTISENNNNNVIGKNDKNQDEKKQMLECWQKISICLKNIKDTIGFFNNKNYIINSNDYRIFCVFNNKQLFYERNNLLNLIYSKLIKEKNFIRSLLKIYLPLSILRLRNAKLRKKTDLAELEKTKSINDIINDFITNINIQKNKESEVFNNNKIIFDCKIKNSREQTAKITINFFFFNIFIKIPINKEYNAMNFSNQIIILINYINNNKDEFYINNNPIDKSEIILKKCLKCKNFFLLEKLRNLFEMKIYYILKEITFEKNNLIVGYETLIECCKRFILYIYDYNQLFKTRCGICEKIVKYSFNDKNFYPPYIKIYNEKEFVINDKNKYKDAKLFYHEECFKKLDISNLLIP